jgi:hypothetical protein
LQASSLFAKVAHRTAEANMLSTGTARMIFVIKTIDIHSAITTVETSTAVVTVRSGKLCSAQIGDRS